jgi:hypothetical protein
MLSFFYSNLESWEKVDFKMCENCGRKIIMGWVDKVSNKKVCDSCKEISIDLRIRFEFDFERLF